MRLSQRVFDLGGAGWAGDGSGGHYSGVGARGGGRLFRSFGAPEAARGDADARRAAGLEFSSDYDYED